MTNKKRWQERFCDYQRAVNRLEEALNKNQINELEKDGVIQRFEFTFELAWKTMKSYLENQGFNDVASPKKSLKQGFESELIKDGDTWIDMLEDRNRMSHLYNQDVSELIFNNIKERYVGAFRNLINILEKE